MGIKKEAEELVYVIYKKIDWVTRAMPKVKKELAKELAIISVNRTIKALKTTLGHLELRPLDANEYLQDIKYWQKVKQEVEKL